MLVSNSQICLATTLAQVNGKENTTRISVLFRQWTKYPSQREEREIMYSNKHAIRALAKPARKLETKVFRMNTFSTLILLSQLSLTLCRHGFAFLHIYSYLKIYGVINVDFCVNCKNRFLFLSVGFRCALFYRVHSVTENHQVCKHFTPFENPTFICTTCFSMNRTHTL